MNEFQERIREELLKDYKRHNRKISEVMGVSQTSVRTVRYQMEDDEDIPVWRSGIEINKLNERIRGELLKDCRRTSLLIADTLGCSQVTVGARRLEMEKTGTIPFWRGGNSGSEKQKVRKKIADELLLNHEQSNSSLGRLHNCSSVLVSSVRQELEKSGQILFWRSGSHGYNLEEMNEMIERELLKNPSRINFEIANLLRCSPAKVGEFRRTLESAGKIPFWRGTASGNHKPQDTYVFYGMLTQSFKVGITSTLETRRK